MVVRIRLGLGPRIRMGPRNTHRIAQALGALLSPAAVVALLLGFWRLAADLRLASEFGISSGLFSHWQVWLTAAGFLQWGAWALSRYGRRDSGAAS